MHNKIDVQKKKKKSFDFYFKPFTKISQGGDRLKVRLNVKPKTIELIKEHWKKSLWLEVRQRFLICTNITIHKRSV